jgi:hypothetical protein
MFDSMPAEVRDFFSDGLGVLSKLPIEQHDEVKRAAIESLESGSTIDEKGIASRLNISVYDARSVMGAATLFGSLVLKRKESKEDIVASAVEAKILSSEQSPAILRFFASFERDRAALNALLDTAELAGVVLPSLSEFECSVDLRLGFAGQTLSVGVPLVLIHIDTDAAGQEIWFQLRRLQVEQIIKQLQNALEQMDSAGKLLPPNLGVTK